MGSGWLRRRRTVSVAAVAAAVALTVGLVQVSWSGGSRDLQPAPAPSSPTTSDPAEPLRVDGDPFATEFNTIVAQVPDWSVADIQETFTNEPCGVDWASGAGGYSGGNFDVRINGEPGQVWHGLMGFPSAARARAAVDRLVDDLGSCTTIVWQTQSIPQTDAVLASSDQGLIWIEQTGKDLSTLSAVTNDGPPPLTIQVEIADLMRSYLERRDD